MEWFSCSYFEITFDVVGYEMISGITHKLIQSNIVSLLDQCIFFGWLVGWLVVWLVKYYFNIMWCIKGTAILINFENLIDLCVLLVLWCEMSILFWGFPVLACSLGVLVFTFFTEGMPEWHCKVKCKAILVIFLNQGHKIANQELPEWDQS